MNKLTMLGLVVSATVAVSAATGCSQWMKDEETPARGVNLVEQAGLTETTLIAIADGSSHRLRLMITDPQIISGVVDALDTDLSVTPKLFCAPDYEITFKQADGTVQKFGYSCLGASFIRGDQELLRGEDFLPPERFDELIQGQIAAVEALSVNIVEQARLADAIEVQILEFEPGTSSQGVPYVLRLGIGDLGIIDQIVASLNTDLDVAPKVACIPEYELHFKLTDGTVQKFGYSCLGASFLRGDQEFLSNEDFWPPEELDELIREHLTALPPAPPITPANGPAGEVMLRVGDTYEVSLESNPTTGYRWEVGFEFDDRLLELVEQSYEPDSSLVGGGGHETFIFQALGPGRVEFGLIYKRPSEDEALKSQRLILNIGVDAALAEKMTEAQARQIAMNSECEQEGALEENAFYNDWTGTWWIDLDIQKEGCSPACVVDVATETGEVNWRCTGVLPPMPGSPTPVPHTVK